MAVGNEVLENPYSHGLGPVLLQRQRLVDLGKHTLTELAAHRLEVFEFLDEDERVRQLLLRNEDLHGGHLFRREACRVLSLTGRLRNEVAASATRQKYLVSEIAGARFLTFLFLFGGGWGGMDFTERGGGRLDLLHVVVVRCEVGVLEEDHEVIPVRADAVLAKGVAALVAGELNLVSLVACHLAVRLGGRSSLHTHGRLLLVVLLVKRGGRVCVGLGCRHRLRWCA